MKLCLDLQITDSLTEVSDKEHPSRYDFDQWVALVLEGRKEEAELTIRLVDEEEIQSLNRDYRHKDKVTNVLSFPADLPEHIDIPLLGDMIICPEVVKQEANEQQKSLSAHWAHMVIHGTLHLLGYDHIEEQQAETMECIEIELLASIGYANPYHEHG
ncbi:MAG: putative rRNA maturation factor [Pseudohongiellaceae bacterium]|jgi:probable rRNA maturation factor